MNDETVEYGYFNLFIFMFVLTEFFIYFWFRYYIFLDELIYPTWRTPDNWYLLHFRPFASLFWKFENFLFFNPVSLFVNISTVIVVYFAQTRLKKKLIVQISCFYLILLLLIFMVCSILSMQLVFSPAF